MARGFCDSMTDDVFEEKLEGAQVEDSGALSYSNANISSSQSSLRVYKYGKVANIYITVFIPGDKQDISAGTEIATIPSGFRPSYQLKLPVAGGVAGGDPILTILEISPSGSLFVSLASSGIKKNRYYVVTSSYIVD